MNLKYILAPALFLFLTACKKEVATTAVSPFNELASTSLFKENKTKIFKGPEVNMGNGKARSVLILDQMDKPLSLTIEMSNAALTGLPTERTEYVLPLHLKAKEATPFNHIAVDWNPHGHEPNNMYGSPHFDFHFYKISLQERLAIAPYSGASVALFDNFPPEGYMPPTYFPTPGGVPQMGKHWADRTSPEFNQQLFTKTFIYGSYNGQVIFMEPMITLELIKSKANSQTNIKLPEFFAPTNTYYPTVYRIEADAASHLVSLAQFVWRKKL